MVFDVEILLGFEVEVFLVVFDVEILLGIVLVLFVAEVVPLDSTVDIPISLHVEDEYGMDEDVRAGFRGPPSPCSKVLKRLETGVATMKSATVRPRGMGLVFLALRKYPAASSSSSTAKLAATMSSRALRALGLLPFPSEHSRDA